MSRWRKKPVVKFYLQDGARVQLHLERAEIVQLDDSEHSTNREGDAE